MTITTIHLIVYFDNNIKTSKHFQFKHLSQQVNSERESQVPYSISQQGSRTLQSSHPLPSSLKQPITPGPPQAP